MTVRYWLQSSVPLAECAQKFDQTVMGWNSAILMAPRQIQMLKSSNATLHIKYDWRYTCNFPFQNDSLRNC